MASNYYANLARNGKMTKLLDYSRQVKKINHVLPDAPIDIVYTYVNYNDPAFQKEIAKYRPEKNLDLVRYQEFGEIYYSLTTLETFAKPLVRRIFLVSFNQKLDHNRLSPWVKEKLQYVFHNEIIPEQFLPTFNSIVIEAFLFRIPNLSENFIYLNDDLFLGNQLTRDILFTQQNVPIIYIKKMDYPLPKSSNTPWLYYYENVKTLFAKTYKIYPNLKPVHLPIMMNRILSRKVWEKFGENLIPTMTKFREIESMNFWFLCYLVGLYEGYYVYRYPDKNISIYLNCNLDTEENRQSTLQYLREIFKYKPVFFNINNINQKCLPIWNFVKDKYLLAYQANLKPKN